jgi:hypothetical protein
MIEDGDMVVLDFGGLKDGSGSALPVRFTSPSRPRNAGSTTGSAKYSRPASRRSAPGPTASRSAGPPAR